MTRQEETHIDGRLDEIEKRIKKESWWEKWGRIAVVILATLSLLGYFGNWVFGDRDAKLGAVEKDVDTLKVQGIKDEFFKQSITEDVNEVKKDVDEVKKMVTDMYIKTLGEDKLEQLKKDSL